jgi:enamine deaminase RidA (YjgF/YER057c/UK114 family)
MERRRDQRHVVADDDEALRIDLRPGQEIVEAAHAIGRDAAEDIGGGGLDALGQQPWKGSGIRLVRIAVSARGQGERDVRPALPRSRALRRGLSTEQGYDAARLVGLNMLANVKAQLGSLDRVKRVVKVLGMVNADPEFKDHPKVINGFSDLMVEVFGDAGRGARSAVGMGSLPFQIAVEVEMILEVRD